MFGILQPRRQSVRRALSLHHPRPGEPSFVTKVFEVQGRTSNLELTINTNLINDWAYFNLALINEATGDAFDFGREVSYYTGSDSDGAWSEGGRSSTRRFLMCLPGRYYLRVEPEMEGSETPPTRRRHPPLHESMRPRFRQGRATVFITRLFSGTMCQFRVVLAGRAAAADSSDFLPPSARHLLKPGAGHQRLSAPSGGGLI